METVRRFAQIRQKPKRQEVAGFQPPGQPFQAGQVYSPKNGLANTRIKPTRTARTARPARLKHKLLNGAPSRHRTHRYLLRDLTHATLARQPAVWCRCTITLQKAAYECHLLNKGCRTLHAADRWGLCFRPSGCTSGCGARRVRIPTGCPCLAHPQPSYLQRATCNSSCLLPRASRLIQHRKVV